MTTDARAEYDASLHRLNKAVREAAAYGIGVDLAQAALGKLIQHVVGEEGSDAWLLWHADLHDRVSEGLPEAIEQAKALHNRSVLLQGTQDTGRVLQLVKNPQE